MNLYEYEYCILKMNSCSLLVNEKFGTFSTKILRILRQLKLMAYIKLVQPYKVLSVPCASQ